MTSLTSNLNWGSVQSMLLTTCTGSIRILGANNWPVSRTPKSPGCSSTVTLLDASNNPGRAPGFCTRKKYSGSPPMPATTAMSTGSTRNRPMASRQSKPEKCRAYYVKHRPRLLQKRRERYERERVLRRLEERFPGYCARHNMENPLDSAPVQDTK